MGLVPEAESYPLWLFGPPCRLATATAGAVRLALQLENQLLAEVDALRAISGRGHACSAARAGSCRVRP